MHKAESFLRVQQNKAIAHNDFFAKAMNFWLCVSVLNGLLMQPHAVGVQHDNWQLLKPKTMFIQLASCPA